MRTVPRTKLISVVTPCFNEHENIRRCYETTRQVLETSLPGYDYEHIFCDNASTDTTVDQLREFAAADPRVKVILNARNFGPIQSNFNGLLAAQGDAVLVCLPADLQDPPELIPQFVERWAAGCHVVYGIRARREEGTGMQLIRKLFYRLIARCSDVPLPVDVGLFQLIDRSVVESLRRCDDHFPFMNGLIAHCGLNRAGIEYTWRKRERSLSKATWGGLFSQGLNALVSLSTLPSRWCMLAGISAALAGAACGLTGLIADAASGRPPLSSLAPAVLGAVAFFSGVQLFFLGLIGEYAIATHGQVRRRPLVVERERINFPTPRPALGEPTYRAAG